MRIVLDTNVVMSAVFFGGVPGEILVAWRGGRLAIVVSPSILDEYRRVGALLAAQYQGVDFEPFTSLLAVHAEVVDTLEYLPEAFGQDPSDQKFLACALGASVTCIVSGDRHLLSTSGWQGIEVLRPRLFVDRYLG